MVISLDMIQTLALAVVVLLCGQLLCTKVSILARFCIPAPVVGGLIFSLLALWGHQSGSFSFDMNMVLKDFFMMLFFTTIGFTASIQVLKKGGLQVFIFLACAVVLVALQNVVGVALAKVFSLNPLIGLATGSTPMTGGHGTSAAFAPLFEELGAHGAYAVAIASATFGLIMGSMIGGPVARTLITRNHLLSKAPNDPAALEHLVEEEEEAANAAHPKVVLQQGDILVGFYLIAIAMGIGSFFSFLIQKTGLTMPAYIGAMFAAAIIRNIGDYSGGKFSVCMDEIGTLGDLFLSLFLAMALMSLKLWELAELAGPMMVMLLAQTLLTGCFAFFITFRLMGKDYDAAVMAAGHCGFGMGATPNAMANMKAVTNRFGPSVKAFFIVPIVGSLFIDFFNASIITMFMNMFK
ncbi:sodium/glutamate symporter [Deltaproteobacteria bacterium Smac51]|nr:sodium/glutamate symporter [Deltaproteobacteria bacterium Smac51]